MSVTPQEGDGSAGSSSGTSSFLFDRHAPSTSTYWNILYEEDDTPLTIDEVNVEHTVKLGVNAVQFKWFARDGFRELVRSWRQSILETYRLPESMLCIRRFEKVYGNDETIEIIFMATMAALNDHGNTNPNDTSNDDNNDNNDNDVECLGYIRYVSAFQCNNDNFVNGIIDFVNRGVTLQPWHLDLGTTKGDEDSEESGDEGSAGSDIYCESLPFIFSAFMRNRPSHYSIEDKTYRKSSNNVMCTSGGLLWTGNYNCRGRPIVRLRRLREIDEQCTADEHDWMTEFPFPQTDQGSLALFAPDIETDVHIRIGDSRYRHCYGRPCGRNVISRDESGYFDAWDGVALKDFMSWTMSTLCLYRLSMSPDDIVSTPHGDILLTPTLQGFRYINGFLVSDERDEDVARVNNLRYGYNFKLPYKKDERTWPLSALQESLIRMIWDAALAQRPNLAPLVHSMLQHEPAMTKNLSLLSPDQVASCLDVHSIEKQMSSRFAGVLWQHLRHKSRAVGQGGRGGIWYYSWQQQIANPQLLDLISAQDRRGVRLADAYWTRLRERCNIFLLDEKDQRELVAAPVVAVGVRLNEALPVALPGSPAVPVPVAPTGHFQKNLIRMLHASFLGTERTRRTGFLFVKPDANIQFDIVYVANRRTFYINAEWLSLPTVAYKLGFVTAEGTHALDAAANRVFDIFRPPSHPLALQADDMERYVILHAAKTLFAWALKRLPSSSPHQAGPLSLTYGYPPDATITRQDRKAWAVRAENRLLDYLSINDSLGIFLSNGNKLTLSFLRIPGLYRHGAEVAVQCHRRSCTARGYGAAVLGKTDLQPLRNRTILARDMNTQDMPCLRHVPGQPGAPGVMDMHNCCTTGRLSLLGNRTFATTALPGESYFFVVVVNPSDEFAIASMTDDFTVPRMTTLHVMMTTAPIPTAAFTEPTRGPVGNTASAVPNTASHVPAGNTASHVPSVNTASHVPAQSYTGTNVAGEGDRKRRRT
ncbi:hypothetical protein SCUCBS95973_004753 [Sporothrix curviconia]|uniref:Uncharacterized protein n=1 Tax=Sporothrix curviconia TaxID=1260050 RepID=A0ABP0BS08_9PEZI